MEELEFRDRDRDDDYDDYDDVRIEDTSFTTPEQLVPQQSTTPVEVLNNKESVLLRLKKDLWGKFGWPSENLKLSIDDRQLSERNIFEKDGYFYFKVIKDDGGFKDIKLNKYKGKGEFYSINTLAAKLGVNGLKEFGIKIKSNNISKNIVERLPTEVEIKSSTDGDVIKLVGKVINIVKETTIEETTTDDFGIHQGTQTEGLNKAIQTEGLSLRELIGLNKAMQTLSGSLKKAVAEKTKTEIHIDMEYGKLKEIKRDLTATDEQRKEIHDRITNLKDRLQAHNDEIKILKDKFSSQVTQIKETFKKLMDKDKTLGEKIRILFREQGITITTLLTAIGMTIGFLVELLTPASVSITPSPSPSPDKSWIKKKLEALKNLLGKLAAKAGAALPGIIGSIVSWILNRVKDVVGFIAKETWILIVGIGLFLINSIRK